MDWKSKIIAMYRDTQSPGKKKFLASVLVQIVDYGCNPTSAQAALLNQWHRHYLKKHENPVLQQCEADKLLL